MTDKELPHGAEIYFTDDREVFPANSITILDSGWIEAINEVAYTVEYFPPHKVDYIATHTTDEQEEQFNTKDIGHSGGGR